MEAGERIDGWVIERRLGSGGMGSVYRCRNASTERIVAALKVLDRSLRQNADASTRFVREAEILAGLDHPNIVRVRNVRIDADPPYLEMEFVEGEALDALIRRGPVAYPLARDFALQLASAMEYLHARGVKHRDLKPANVLVDPQNRVRLVDFGLATETALERITEEGLNFGTVSYAPPEWMEPDRLDPVQWDLYALGVVFHELLTGRIAFPMSGEGPVKKQLLQVMMAKQVAPPLDPGPAFPAEVRQLVADLTRLDPSARPTSATDVLARLRALPERLEEVTPRREDRTAAPGPQALVPTVPPKRRRMWLVPVLGAGGLAVTLAAAAWLRAGGGPEVPPPEPVPLSAPPRRPVELRFPELPTDWPVRVVLGEETAVATDGVARFPSVPTGAATATWIAGSGCDACPGSGCPDPCGTGTVPVEAGSGEASVVVPARPGAGTVFVEVPAVLRDGGKGKRKRRWDLAGRLGGRTVTSDGATLRFADVAPGRHAVHVMVGECPPAASGCWPAGTCPEKCRSATLEAVVPFGGGEVRLRSDVPTP